MKINIRKEVTGKALEARAASRTLRGVLPERKNSALRSIAASLKKNRSHILVANRRDLALARKHKKPAAFIDRLSLSEKDIGKIADTVSGISRMDDPVGAMENVRVRPNGLRIGKMRVPIGVIGIIYEARPNVTVDAAALCLKSGNAVVLRGGSDAFQTNRALVGCIEEALVKNELPPAAVTFLPFLEYEAVNVLASLEGIVDCIIPRGGESLIRAIVRAARVPVIKHYMGNCHLYVDSPVDMDMAVRVVVNAKTERFSVCNAMETLLVHRDTAGDFLPRLKKELDKYGVEIRGCVASKKILPSIKRAVKKDWGTEFLAPVLALRVVENIDTAIAHIAEWGSGHTDGILTASHVNSEKFIREVDSASVMVNTSTRFSDGGEYGMGAEIGISTDKLHARGPMGLNDLTTCKYVVLGEGQIRSRK